MTGGGLQHVVLVGAGPRHRAVLWAFGHQRPVNLRITLVSHCARPIDASRLGDFVMGFDGQADCETDLEPLLKASGAVLKLGQVATLSLSDKRLTLTDDAVLPFDQLSVEPDGVLDRIHTEATLPGALQRALFTQPVEVFCKLWPQFLALTRRKPLGIAVIGDGLPAVELALAVAARLAHDTRTQAHRVSLVMHRDSDDPFAPAPLARVLNSALKRAQITVLYDRCVSVADSEILLASGMRLACDAPVVALSPAQPAWLASPAEGAALAGLGLAPQAKPTALPWARAQWTTLGYRRAACWVHTRWGSTVLTGTWVWAWKRWREQVHRKQTLCNKTRPPSPPGRPNP